MVLHVGLWALVLDTYVWSGYDIHNDVLWSPEKTSPGLYLAQNRKLRNKDIILF